MNKDQHHTLTTIDDDIDVHVNVGQHDNSGYGAISSSNRLASPISISHSLRTTTTIPMTRYSIVSILSTAFSYSCIMTTFFILIGPIECQRIEYETSRYYSYTISKSIALGGFACIAGLAQLISPLVGLLSDCYIPSKNHIGLYHFGKRMPYLILGTILVVIGLMGQFWASSPIHPVTIYIDIGQSNTNSNTNTNTIFDLEQDHIADTTTSLLGPPQINTKIEFCGAWFQYIIFFLISMLGLNMVYTVMFVLIPDLVPPCQTGVANGTLALLIVSGSLFGFFCFDILLDNDVMRMYKMYICVSIIALLLTCLNVYERETLLKKTDFQEHHNHETNGTESINDSEELTDLEKKEKGTEEEYSYFPQPHVLVYLLLYEPIMNKKRSEMLAAYWIDTSEHYDFFIVTLSRFFYYMGVSSQTFFLYFIHDALKQTSRTQNGEAVVALLAIVAQSAGAITCYPVGILSDQYFGGRRKPFVYAACFLLSIGNLSLMLCHTLRDMIGICVLLGASNGMYLTMDTSLAVDTLDIDEVEEEEIVDDTLEERSNLKKIVDQGQSSHHDGAAQLLGIWGVFGFIGSALGPLIGGTALLIFGNRTSNSTYYDINNFGGQTSNSTYYEVNSGTMESSVPVSPFYSEKGYKALFSLSSFYFFCSALILAFVRKKGV